MVLVIGGDILIIYEEKGNLRQLFTQLADNMASCCFNGLFYWIKFWTPLVDVIINKTTMQVATHMVFLEITTT